MIFYIDIFDVDLHVTLQTSYSLYPVQKTTTIHNAKIGLLCCWKPARTTTGTEQCL